MSTQTANPVRIIRQVLLVVSVTVLMTLLFAWPFGAIDSGSVTMPVVTTTPSTKSAPTELTVKLSALNKVTSGSSTIMTANYAVPASSSATLIVTHDGHVLLKMRNLTGKGHRSFTFTAPSVTTTTMGRVTAQLTPNVRTASMPYWTEASSWFKLTANQPLPQ